jgi:mono/diheme cytochrome c family protein
VVGLVEVGSIFRVARIAGLTCVVGAGLACLPVPPLIGYADAAPAKPASPTAGPKLFKRWCGDCHHTAAGPGSMALARKYQGSLPALLEQRTDTTPDFIRYVVRRGASFMPPFRKTEITDAELDQLALYLTRGVKRSRASSAGGK